MNQFLIIIILNIIFIAVVVALIFVPIDGFSSAALVGIVSAVFLGTDAILTLYFLKSKPLNHNENGLEMTVNTKRQKKPQHIKDESEAINREEVQGILGGDKDGITTTTNGDVYDKELQQKYDKEAKKTKQLQRENKLLMDEYQEFKESNTKTAKDNVLLIEQCEKLEEKNKKYSVEVDKLKQEIQEMQEKIDKQQEEKANDVKDIEIKIINNETQQQQQNAQHLEELENLRNTHDIKLKEMENLQSTHDLKLKEMEDLRNTHDVKLKEMEDLQNTHDLKLREIESLQREKEELERTQNDLMTKYEAEAMEKQQHLTENEQLKAQIGEHDVKRQRLKTEAETYQSENVSLKGQIEELEKNYNNMLKQISKLQQQLQDKESVQSEYNVLQANLNIIDKQLKQYEADLAKERQENIRLKESVALTENELENYKSLNNSRASMDSNYESDKSGGNENKGGGQIDHLRDKVDKLQKDLAHAQKTIINMTTVVGVQQQFPTVQETIQQYRSIRDQKHHDTSTLLKKFIKKNCGTPKWQKYYINQVVHEIMFDILLKCYKANENYRLEIYDNIANQLNMKYAIADAFEIKRDDIEQNEENKKVIQKQYNKILSNIFGAYFKNHFKHVLQRKLVNNQQTIGNDDDDDDDEDEVNEQEEKPLIVDNIDGTDQNEKSLVDEILEEVIEEYKKYNFDKLGKDEIDGLKEYIIECCEVCWVMILQDPPLHLQPSNWKCLRDGENVPDLEENGDDENESKDNQGVISDDEADHDHENTKNDKILTVYDERYHKRVLGSDRNCKNILYHVWPAVARNGVVLGDQKVDVILRDEMYTQFKPKKNANSKQTSNDDD